MRVPCSIIEVKMHHTSFAYTVQVFHHHGCLLGILLSVDCVAELEVFFVAFRTVMDIPYADLLPHLWYTIKQLSCDPVTGNAAQSHEAQARNFRTKGFSLLEFPPFIKQAFEPLQVCQCVGE